MAMLVAVVTCMILLLQGKQAADARARGIHVTVPENLDYSTLFSDLFAAYTTSSKLLRVKTVPKLYDACTHRMRRSKKLPAYHIRGMPGAFCAKFIGA